MAFILVASHGLIISNVVLILVPLVLNVGAESETAVPSAALVRFVVVGATLLATTSVTGANAVIKLAVELN